MASSAAETDEITPLLARTPEQQRKRSRISSHASSNPSFGSSSMRRNTLREVHPDPSEVEPSLPASAVPAHTATALHKPMWSHHDGEPNLWASFRHAWREELAEFLGTFMILLFGAGVECQVTLHYNSTNSGHGAAYGDYLQCRLSWAVGVAMAVWVSGGVSGGHCNPTVTIVLALFRGFPFRKIPSIILAQLAGATCASLCVYLNYTHSISRFEGGDDIRTVIGPHSTAGLFFTFPAPYLPDSSAFYTEFLASAVLVIIVFALADKGNLSPPQGTQPFAMFLALVGIGAALGVNTGYAMNGARDSGPRIALWLVGYGNEAPPALVSTTPSCIPVAILHSIALQS
ncbi:hypothetical protein FH972_021329 [Carpinus fangiana]|uniref:Aquaporin n=1 Tax=Carpinus fangiana TaxID=176857 RepID=A0A5N6KPM1_9ROSI|nr:hypothetical protein FH972_021329 [Carpinus fangiana]